MGKKSAAIILATCLLAAFAIRFFAAIRCDARPDFSDMAVYNEAALASGIPTSLPPGYPLFLRGVYALFGASNYKAVFVVQGLLGTLMVGLIYRITRELGSRRAALIAAWTAAVYPSFIAYGLTTMTETIVLLCVALVSAVMVASMSEKRRSLLAAILLCAGAVFKPVVLFFAPGLFASLKRRLTFAAALAVVLVPLIIVALFSGSETKRAARGIYRSYNPASTGEFNVDIERTELGKDDLPAADYIKASLAFIRDNRWKALDIMYNKTSIVFSRGWDSFVLGPLLGGGKDMRQAAYYILTYAYIPIMLLGFMGMIRMCDERNRFLALMTLSYLSIFLLVLIFKVRYRLLIEPILIVYAAILVEGSLSRLSMPKIGAWFRRLFAAPEIEQKSATLASTDQAIHAGRAWKRFIPLWGCRDWDILLVILLAALAIRVYLPMGFEAQLDSREAKTYNSIALGGGFDTGAPPLYPLFLRATYAVFGAGNFKAVFLIQGILGALVVLLMYTVVTQLWSRRAGIIAAALSAAYPDFIVYNLNLLPDSLIILLVVLLMAAAGSRLGNGSKALVSAALGAAGILLNPVLVCLVPGVLVTTKRWRLYLLVLMLLLVPYTIRNVMRHRPIEPVYAAQTYNLSLKSYSGPKIPWTALDAIYKNASAVLARGWETEKGLESSGVMRNSAYAAVYGYTIIMVLGLIGLFRRYRREHREAVLSVLLCITALILFSKFEIRYRVPLEPVFVAYAAMLFGGRRRG